MTVKLSKTELRTQQVKLTQLRKYLPTLQLKKSMLQMEVFQAQIEIEDLTTQFKAREESLAGFAVLFSDKFASDLFSSVHIIEVKKAYENIAGIDIPVYEKIEFQPPEYELYYTPVWLETAIEGVKEFLTIREKIKVAREKKEALERELREVSIRVNLFEKIMIPRAIENIKKIKIFLSDQELAAVSQAKVSKRKILRNLEQIT
ncbi:MAG TPA: V-type ATP synthase subunit D [Rhabdochlamydiaceae bacterium]|nr:V-type ATP synthase subunit D [Rhabdochlamydiaceae bacterium]